MIVRRTSQIALSMDDVNLRTMSSPLPIFHTQPKHVVGRAGFEDSANLPRPPSHKPASHENVTTMERLSRTCLDVNCHIPTYCYPRRYSQPTFTTATRLFNFAAAQHDIRLGADTIHAICLGSNVRVYGRQYLHSMFLDPPTRPIMASRPLPVRIADQAKIVPST